MYFQMINFRIFVFVVEWWFIKEIQINYPLEMFILYFSIICFFLSNKYKFLNIKYVTLECLTFHVQDFLRKHLTLNLINNSTHIIMLPYFSYVILN